MELSLSNLSILVLLIPLLSFVVVIFFGKKIPGNGNWLSTSLLFINLIISLYILFSFLKSGVVNVSYDWFNLGTESSKFKAGVVIDELSAIMLVVVNIISSFVHLFSIKYMEGDAK